MSDKLCPFNNMNSCIKEECAMYLKTDSITYEGEKITGNIFSAKFTLPCALIFPGMKAALELMGIKKIE